MKRVIAILAAVMVIASPVGAQQAPRSAPVAVAPQPALPAPKDVAYPGTLTLQVDATDLDRRIFNIKQKIPVAKAGPLTL